MEFTDDLRKLWMNRAQSVIMGAESYFKDQYEKAVAAITVGHSPSGDDPADPDETYYASPTSGTSVFESDGLALLVEGAPYDSSEEMRQEAFELLVLADLKDLIDWKNKDA